mmetsp:Transcript_88483/g.230642  ORF Transcript_88483/g.230642 Transcript_88483/m.230642 type:complete len:447 (+) Transcript_88483:59-1399(+)
MARTWLWQVCLAALCHAPTALRPGQLSGTSFRQMLDNHHDMSYVGNMTVGGQRLQGVYDSGSLELVVVSDKCKSWCGSEQRMFHAAHSATYQHGPMSVVLEYGSGEVLGKEAYETVSVGPLGSTEAPFWEVVDANMPLLQQSGFGAIVGLGPIPADATVLRPHGAENNKSFALLMRKLGADRYSVCLGRTPLSPGVLVWNDGLVESMPRAFTKVTTVEGGFWLTSLTDVRFGSTPVACFEPGSCGAILDSGTSLISTPEDAFVSIGELVEQLSVDCDNIAELPELHFKLDGIPHSLPPDSYIGRVRGNSTDGVKSHFRTSGSAAPSCQTTLMKINMDSAAGAVWVLGMPFFRRYYSAFVQATTESRASVYTALAGPDCQPVQGISQALQRGTHGQQKRVEARVVDASQVRMPSWLHRGARSGRLEDGRIPRHPTDRGVLDVHAQPW